MGEFARKQIFTSEKSVAIAHAVKVLVMDMWLCSANKVKLHCMLHLLKLVLEVKLFYKFIDKRAPRIEQNLIWKCIPTMICKLSPQKHDAKLLSDARKYFD